MGCCLSRDQSSLADSEELEGEMRLGKSRPLLQERLKWRSEAPLTEGQLRSKRDEFWETAPAFEGRREIWDALRAAAAQAEAGDWAMAAAILEGASVLLPDGTLREAYDELGNRYQVPIYCLFHPINLLEAKSETSVASKDTPEPLPPVSTELPQGGTLLNLKLRLSTVAEGGGDLSVQAKSTETVGGVKRRLIASQPLAPPHSLPADPADQRWYYGGRYLHDRATLADCSVPPGFVVQVIVRSADDCPVISTAPKPTAKKPKKHKRKRDKDKAATSSNGAALPATAEAKAETAVAEPAASEADAATSSQTGVPAPAEEESAKGHSQAAASLQEGAGRDREAAAGESRRRPGTRDSVSSLHLSSLSNLTSSNASKDPPPVQ